MSFSKVENISSILYNKYIPDCILFHAGKGSILIYPYSSFSERLLKRNYNNGIGDVKWHWGMDQTENFGKCLEGICKCMCPEGEIEL